MREKDGLNWGSAEGSMRSKKRLLCLWTWRVGEEMHGWESGFLDQGGRKKVLDQRDLEERGVQWTGLDERNFGA